MAQPNRPQHEGLRVVHVTDGTSWAGIESHLWSLEHAARAADPPLQTLFCLSREGEPARRFRSSGATVRVLPDGLVRAVLALRRLLRRVEPDVLHMHGYLGVLLGCAASLGLRPALVSTWHARIDPTASPAARIWWYSRLALRVPLWRGAHFVAVTEDIARDYRTRGAPDERIHVVRNGIDAPEPASPHAERRPPGAPLQITAIGSLLPVKDFGLLIRVARVLAERGTDAVFTVAGDGPLRSSLEREAADLGVAERVRFVGRIDEASSLLAETDVFISTSRSEGVPYALLEALAAGLPVVAPPVGGFLEVLRSEETGLIAEERSASAIADCLIRLDEDHALRRRLAAGAASAARGELSARRMLGDTLRVYAASRAGR